MIPSDLTSATLALPAAAFGQPLTVLGSTGSTNDEARRRAEEGAPHGTTVVADHQTAGRGSHGRAWHSPAGVNLYLSIVLRPVLPPARVPLLPLTIGLAVCDVVERHTGCPTQVKWPNDVWVQRRKLAGVLVEASTSGAAPSALRYAVAGIGLDVNERELSPELRGVATSMALVAGRTFDRSEVLLDLLRYVDRWLDRLVGGADIATALAGRAALVSERATIDGRPCVVEGIDSAGALRVRTDAGIERCWSGQLAPASALPPSD